MSWVNLDNEHTAFSSFIREKAVKRVKAPGMQAALDGNILVRLATSDLGCLSNVGQILNHDSAASGAVLHNSFGEDMITVPVESHLFSRKLFEVLLGRLCSFGLKFAFQAKATTVNFFPVASTKELTLGGDSGSVETQVNTHNLIDRGDVRLRDLYDHMQPVLPVAVNKIGSSDPMPLVLCAKTGYGKRDSHLTAGGGQTRCLGFPVESRGLQVVPHGAQLALRTFHRMKLGDGITLLFGFFNFPGGRNFMFLFSSTSTCEGFSCFDTRLDKQVTYQSRTPSYHGTSYGANVHHSFPDAPNHIHTPR